MHGLSKHAARVAGAGNERELLDVSSFLGVWGLLLRGLMGLLLQDGSKTVCLGLLLRGLMGLLLQDGSKLLIKDRFLR